MAGLFTEVNDNLTQEQKMAIAKRGGQLKSGEKSPEEKLYLVVLKYNEDTDIATTCDRLSEMYGHDLGITDSALTIIGRKAMYDRISDILIEDTSYYVDIKSSMVFVEGVPLDKHISLYRFIDLCVHTYPDKKGMEDLINSYLSAEEELDGIEEETPQEEVQATGLGNNCGTVLLGGE